VGAFLGKVFLNPIWVRHFLESVPLMSGLAAALVGALIAWESRSHLGKGRIGRGRLGGVLAVLVQARFQSVKARLQLGHAISQLQDDLDQSAFIQCFQMLAS
jgi:hypothetical protein